ncbi:hypothetical protein BI330_07120 [Mycobacterium sp. CBMA 623]|nr:hypothetical protein [Mycobacteroides sp. CBMA 326]
MPNYDTGRGYPAPDQSNGVSIYNTPGQSAPDQGGHGSGNASQPQPWDRAANGEQTPADRQPLPYSQAPSQPNPEYRPPAQQPPQAQPGNPQQGHPSPQQQDSAPHDPSESDPQREPDDNADYIRENGKDNTPEQCKQGFAELAAGQPLSDFEMLYTLGSDHVQKITMGILQSNVLVYQSTLNGIPADALSDAISQWNGALSGARISPKTNANGSSPIMTIRGEKQGNNGITASVSRDPVAPELIINESYFSQFSDAEQKSKLTQTFLHELGHALGLAHSCPGTVMHNAQDSLANYSLSTMDVTVANRLWPKPGPLATK